MKRLVGIYLLTLTLCSGCPSQPGVTPETIPEGQVVEEEVSADGLTSEEKAMLADPDLDPEMRIWVQASRTFPRPETSIDKINKARREGVISELEAHTQRIYAHFYPDKVYEELRGHDREFGDAIINVELGWLQEHFSELNDEQKEDLLEFVVSPLDERSYFYPAKTEEAQAPLTLLAASSMKKPMKFLDTANKKAFIAYPTGMEEQAEAIKKAVDKAWPLLTNLLGVEPPDTPKKHLFTLSQFKERKDKSVLLGTVVKLWHERTIQTPEGPKKEKYFTCGILLNKEEIFDEETLQSTTVHEFSHCLQLYVGYQQPAKTFDRWWVMEATAKWSEHFVFPSYNNEHKALEYFFTQLDVDLLETDMSHHYGSYMWFFFLVQYLSQQQYPVIVADIMHSALQLSPREAIMQNVPNYKEAFAEFAIWNVNRYDFRRYNDDPDFPEYSKYCNPALPEEGKELETMPCIPTGDAVRGFTEDTPRTHVATADLTAGEMNYHVHRVKDIKRILFEFDSLEQTPHLRRQAAIFYKDGNIVLENWSHEGQRLFCLDRPDENIKAVMMVLSNSDLLLQNSISYQVETSDTPCEIRAYTRLNMKAQSLEPGEEWYFNAQLIQNDTVEYSLERNEYVLTARSASFTKNGTDVCGYPIKGNGSLTETYTIEEGPTKFVLSPEIPSMEELGELGAELDIEGSGTQLEESLTNLSEIKGWMHVYPAPLDPDVQRWVTYTDASIEVVSGCKLAGYQTNQGVPMVVPGLVMLKKEDIKEDRISGQRQMQSEEFSYDLAFEYKK